jgi:hypothetical protein
VRRQAEGYRLAVAEFPVDLLTSSWSHGSNRPVDGNHVAHLCRTFRQGNLARRAEENYMQVTCSAGAVKKMMSRVVGRTGQADGRDSDVVQDVQLSCTYVRTKRKCTYVYCVRTI